ncbi:MAG: DNA repair protein RadC [Lachnospiraceae bacterium]|nr:DNA repair protein RadC [Lachnospiraceae bacterium]
MPEDERPYEKCEKYGPAALTDAELLAVVIKSGTQNERAVDLAYRVLKLNPVYTGINCLFHLSMPDLKQIGGIGRVKAIQLVCVAELSRRMNRAETLCNVNFSEAEQTAKYYMEYLRHMEHEEVHAAFLDVKMKLLTSECVFKGALSKSLLEPREVFSLALKYNAAGIILAHNHPSGDPTPSPEDVASTNRIRACGEYLGIRLYDHIVIGQNRYVSMKELGII